MEHRAEVLRSAPVGMYARRSRGCEMTTEQDAVLAAYRDADEWGKKFGDDMIAGFVRARIYQLEREKKEQKTQGV
jgi:hypothetical protein